jgi:hypothetical protein
MLGDQGELAIFLAYVHIRIAKVLAMGCWGMHGRGREGNSVQVFQAIKYAEQLHLCAPEFRPCLELLLSLVSIIH